MARLVALGNDTTVTGRLSLRTQLRNLCNIQNSTFFPNAELNEYLNQELPQVHERLVSSYGDKYFYKTQTLTLVGGQQLYPMAVDVGWLWRVELKVFSGDNFHWVDVLRIDSAKKNVINNYPMGTNTNLTTPLRYELQGGDPGNQSAVGAYSLFFVPYPYISGQVIQYSYAPACPVLVADSDVYDFIDGWENACVYGAAAKVRIKQKLDPSGFFELQMKELSRIAEMSERDTSYAEQEHDFEAERGGGPGGYN